MKLLLQNKRKTILFVIAFLFFITITADDSAKTSTIRWESSPGAIGYMVTLKDSKGKIIINKRVDTNAANIPVTGGSYFIRIQPINKFNKIDSEDSSWQKISVKTIGRPFINSITPDYLTPDSRENRITANGKNFTEGMSVTLVNDKTRHNVSSMAILSDKRFTFSFNPSLSGSGLFKIEITTADGTKFITDSSIAIGLEAAALRHSSEKSPSSVASGDNLIYYIIKGNNSKVEELLKAGVNPDTTDKNGFYAVHYAAFFGRALILAKLKNYGANLNVSDKGGAYPIHHAAYKDRLDTVNYIVINGLNDVNSRARNGYAPLDRAAIKGNSRIIDILIKSGAKPDYTFNSGENALHMAVYSGDMDSVKYLLATGKIDVNYQEKRGYTVLHYAAWFGHPEICDYLIRHGADKNVKSKKGETALMLAENTRKKSNRDKIIELLKE
ncbi:MAG TPA: ankyrin repeat domain-containing protein [Spirochaetota bacterium]|nr:ankyrin repeat domain-containing protein [Spirochaetota bacterium]